MKKVSTAICAALMALPTATLAVGNASEHEQWEFSGMLAYVEPDSKRWDSDYGVGLRAGALYHLTDYWAVEFAATGNSIERKSSGHHWQYGFGPDLLVFLNPERDAWRPYVIGGAGAGIIDTKLRSTKMSAYWSGGLGIMSPKLIGPLKLRAEARYQREFADDGIGKEPYDDVRAYVGVSMPWGYAPAPKPEPVVAEPEIVEVIVEKEVVVTEPAKVEVSEVLEGVTFEVNSSRLTANARTVLREVAERLKFHQHISVKIAGYTDSTGSADLNKRLSQARADSVKAFLVAEGVSSYRLNTAGYGPANPVASNATAEGREQNRRIEMHRLDDVAPRANNSGERKPAPGRLNLNF